MSQDFLSEIDPATAGQIAQARNEMHKKQNSVLKMWVASGTNNAQEAKRIKEFSDSKFQAFLKEPKNQELVKSALNNEILKGVYQDQLVAIGKEYLQKIEGFPKSSSVELNLANSDNEEVIKHTVKNSKSEEICQIRESFGAYKRFETSDNKRQKVASYRGLEIPMQLAHPTGKDMIFGFALRDENGNDAPRKDGLQVTLEYDARGQLVNATMPKPIKFAGESSHAQGYIEHAGKVYTLPINKGTYTEIASKIGQTGLFIDISQQQSQVTPDYKKMLLEDLQKDAEYFDNSVKIFTEKAKKESLKASLEVKKESLKVSPEAFDEPRKMWKETISSVIKTIESMDDDQIDDKKYGQILKDLSLFRRTVNPEYTDIFLEKYQKNVLIEQWKSQLAERGAKVQENFSPPGLAQDYILSSQPRLQQPQIAPVVIPNQSRLQSQPQPQERVPAPPPGPKPQDNQVNIQQVTPNAVSPGNPSQGNNNLQNEISKLPQLLQQVTQPRSVEGIKTLAETIQQVNMSELAQVEQQALQTAVTANQTPQTYKSLIETVRTEIIGKQKAILQEWIADSIKSKSEAEKLRTLESKAFTEFVANAENKELVDKAIADPSLAAKYSPRLAQAQITASQKIIQQYAQTPLNLGQGTKVVGDQSTITTSDIKKDGEVALTLAEKRPTSVERVIKSDGEIIEVSNFRSVEFPPKLNENVKGPASVALSFFDEHGNRMPKDKAAYLTVHYDEKGNLSEISVPQPIKFMDKVDGSVGYIELEGKVYTLPVNQGQFKELNRQVGLNKGESVNLSQRVEKTEKYLQQSAQADVIKGLQKSDHTITEYTDKFDSKLSKTNHPGTEEHFDKIKSSWQQGMAKAAETVRDSNITQLSDTSGKAYNALVQSVLNDFEPVQNQLENIMKEYPGASKENPVELSHKDSAEITQMFKGLEKKVPERIERRAKILDNTLKISSDSITPEERTAVIHDTIKLVKEKHPGRTDFEQLDNKYEKSKKANGEYEFGLSKEDAESIMNSLQNIEYDKHSAKEVDNISQTTNQNLGLVRRFTSYITDVFSKEDKPEGKERQSAMDISKPRVSAITENGQLNNKHASGQSKEGGTGQEIEYGPGSVKVSTTEDRTPRLVRRITNYATAFLSGKDKIIEEKIPTMPQPAPVAKLPEPMVSTQKDVDGMLDLMDKTLDGIIASTNQADSQLSTKGKQKTPEIQVQSQSSPGKGFNELEQDLDNILAKLKEMEEGEKPKVNTANSQKIEDNIQQQYPPAVAGPLQELRQNVKDQNLVSDSKSQPLINANPQNGKKEQTH